jgi:hypothetical protein
MSTDGAVVRLLWTVQCATTARSAGHRARGRPVGIRTVRWMLRRNGLVQDDPLAGRRVRAGRDARLPLAVVRPHAPPTTAGRRTRGSRRGHDTNSRAARGRKCGRRSQMRARWRSIDENMQVKGALGRIRTCNLLIRSQVLCPLSYERTAKPADRVRIPGGLGGR